MFNLGFLRKGLGKKCANILSRQISNLLTIICKAQYLAEVTNLLNSIPSKPLLNQNCTYSLIGEILMKNCWPRNVYNFGIITVYLQYCLKYISTFALKWFRHVVIKNYNYSFSGYKEILHNGTI